MTWRDLTEELDAWAAAGRRAGLWWRDDDAVEPGPALDRLLDLAAAESLPLALAVVPARASEALARRLAPAPVSVLQHGFAHRNHAPAGAKKIELGGARGREAVLEELARGGARLSALFPAGWTPVLVPPWNRIAAPQLPALPGLGYRGLSSYGPRPARLPVPGLVQVNCHVDILRWTAPRGFLGDGAALGLLVRHLRARRLGEVDAKEPTGLLTHHAAHDEAAWDFLGRLVEHLSGHPGAAFVEAAQIFGGEASAPETRGAA